MTYEEIEKEKERLQAEYHETVETLYRLKINEVFKWFKKRFPKRRLDWWSGMGAFGWDVDGAPFDCETFITDYIANISGHRVLKETKWTRQQVVMRPLIEFYRSISDHTNYSGVWIDIGNHSTDNA